jgi:CheY-like chemotaxis protein
VLQAEDQRRQTAAELDRLRTAEETAQAEQRRLAALLEDARVRDAETARAVGALEAELATRRPAGEMNAAPPSPPAAAVTGATSTAAPTPIPSGTTASGGARSLLVLDVDEAWSAGEGSTLVVSVVAPSDDVATRVAEIGPHRILVNLAAPGAFQAMVTLRAGGCGIRFYGCIARRDDEQTLLLGPVEPAPHRADTDVLVALLTGYAPKAARIMAAGTDANTFISLRQALTRAGMSVSIAWDAKQASDLLEIVRPQLLVLDLGLPPRGAHGLVAQAAAGTPPPVAVLIPGPADPAAGFLAAMLDRSAAAGTPRTRAVQETLRRTDEPPATAK